MKMDIFFGVKLSYLIFSVSEQFSCYLQAKDTRKQLKEQNYWLLIASHYIWSLIFNADVLEQFSGFTEEHTLPRYHRRPRQLATLLLGT